MPNDRSASYDKKYDYNNEELDSCLKRIADKNEEALAELYYQTSAAVYSFALSILRHVHDAEDVLQECYIAVYQAAGGYRSAKKPMAWILTIARNLCLQKLRQQKKIADASEDEWEKFMPDNGNITSEERILLKEALKQLSSEELQIVVLHLVSGFKHREIAQFLEMPLATVLSKYHRALKKLKKNYLQGE